MVYVTTNQLALMEKENAEIRYENDLLRKENQALRRQLIRRAGTSDKNPSGPGTAAGKQASGKAHGDYWLSASGKRHNSSCRYFEKGKGRSCGKDEGTPCKHCGG